MDTRPDPVTAATAWQAYVAAARSLDAARRELVAAHQELAAARWELADTPPGQDEPPAPALPELRHHIDQQQARLTAEAARAGVPVPPLRPGEAELAAAREVATALAAAPGAGDRATATVLRQCQESLAACDAHLAARRRWPRPGLAAVLAGLTVTLVGAGLVLLALILLG